VVDTAIQYGAQGIAYTYNQPSIFIEFARDCGVLARKKGLINIFVSNGYDTPETVKMMDEFLDCITVDFKGSAEPEFTRKFIGVPDPKPIFDTLIELRDKTNIHVEITDLIVPKVGDSLEYAKKLSKFVYDEFGPEMSIHFLRFHPDYKMMEYEPTPIKTLEKHYEIAKKEGLKYVYLGNVPGHPWEHTYCSECNNIVVKRYGFDIQGWNMDEYNKCKFCGNQIPIIGPLHKDYKQNRFQFVN
jgi:pyruvate formate lyase activating enzyme